MKARERYRTPADLLIIVNRVARDGSWADIQCVAARTTWTKRQPLRDGAFPFDARKVT